jgi:hypothetical protein
VVTGDFFLCLKRCLDDFTGETIDMVCELLEGAGAFFLRQAATAARMENILTVRSLMANMAFVDMALNRLAVLAWGSLQQQHTPDRSVRARCHDNVAIKS